VANFSLTACAALSVGEMHSAFSSFCSWTAYPKHPAVAAAKMGKNPVVASDADSPPCPRKRVWATDAEAAREELRVAVEEAILLVVVRKALANMVDRCKFGFSCNYK